MLLQYLKCRPTIALHLAGWMLTHAPGSGTTGSKENSGFAGNSSPPSQQATQKTQHHSSSRAAAMPMRMSQGTAVQLLREVCFEAELGMPVSAACHACLLQQTFALELPVQTACDLA